MELQLDRPDKTRPTVKRGAYFGWIVRGYDKEDIFHVKSVDTLPEAHAIATEWATNGYPEVTA